MSGRMGNLSDEREVARKEAEARELRQQFEEALARLREKYSNSSGAAEEGGDDDDGGEYSEPGRAERL